MSEMWISIWRDIAPTLDTFGDLAGYGIFGVIAVVVFVLVDIFSENL